MDAVKKLPGHPSHKPAEQTRRTVETMSGLGVPHEDIGLSIGVSDVTLRKHYRAELDTGRIKANSAVAQSLYKKAIGDGQSAAVCAIFWAKTQMGWKDTTKLEFDGKLIIELNDHWARLPKS